MAYHLAPHFSAAVRDDDLVLLDLRRGEYACARGAAADLELDPSTQQILAIRPALAADIRAAGVLLTGPGARSGVSLAAKPLRDLGAARRRAGPSDLRWLGPVLADMVWGYWSAGFAQIVSRARRRQARQLSDGPPDRAADLALRLLDLLPWIPCQGDCLFRALLIQAALARHGWSARVVIGVQTWPFEAHAWAQSGDTVLGDGADYVMGFTPILVI